jgi:hypothetical protein
MYSGMLRSSGLLGIARISCHAAALFAKCSRTFSSFRSEAGFKDTSVIGNSFTIDGALLPFQTMRSSPSAPDAEYWLL